MNFKEYISHCLLYNIKDHNKVFFLDNSLLQKTKYNAKTHIDKHCYKII